MNPLSSILPSTTLLICFTISLTGCGGENNTPPPATSIETIAPSSRTESVPDEKPDNPELADANPEAEETTPEPMTEKSNPSPPAKKTAITTGSFSGSIKLTGEIPEIEAFEIPANALALCNAQGIVNESLVINPKNKGIANVFIYIKDAPENANEINSPEAPVTFDQKVCQFIPHAMFIPAGSKVNAINSDVLAHNVHTYPIRNKAVNILLNPKDQKGIMIDYSRTEILPHKIGCDIHPWMTAWHLVLDHPYGVVTDEFGDFTIDNLPTGEHKFRIWQERAGYLEKDHAVTIKAGEENKVSFEYTAETFAKDD